MKTKFTFLLCCLTILFTYTNAQQPSNGGFDVWTNPANPDGWVTINNLLGLNTGAFASQDTSDKLGGVSSLRLQSDTVPGAPQYGVIFGLASLGGGSLGQNGPSFTGMPFTGRPDTLIFDFQHSSPNSADTGRVQVLLTSATETVLNANYLITDEANWTHVEFVLTSLYSNNLTPDTLYIQIQSSGGTGSAAKLGTNLHIDNLRFGYAPQAAAPTGVYTLGSEAIGSNNFNLYGAINTSNDTASYVFVYSTDSTFASYSVTPVQTIHDDSLVVVWAKVNNPTLSSKYFYFIKDSSSAGIKNGAVMNFMTDTVSYFFRNSGADIYGNNYAILNGAVNGLHDTTVLSFIWGSSPGNLDSAIALQTVTDSGGYYFQEPLQQNPGVLPGKIYFFRLMGITATDTIYSDIKAFYMGYPYTTLQAIPVTNITDTSVDMNATIQGFPLPIWVASELDNNVLQTYYHYHPDYYDFTTSVINYTHAASGLVPSQYYGVRFGIDTWIGNWYTDTAFTTLPTGINEIAGPAADLQVYPNPAKNSCTIELNTGTNETAVAQLYNLNGSLVKQFEIPANQTTSTLSLNEFESGVYLLKVVSGNYVFNNKITVIK